MNAYSQYKYHKTSESIGNFVETLTDLNTQAQSHKGGTKDRWWKDKSRKALESIKSGEDLSAALAYLREAQYPILETFQGDIGSVLLRANADEDTDTHVASTSIAFRIERDTLHLYMNRLNHLAGMQNTRGWECCAAQLKHNAVRIELITSKYRYHIQMVCQIYIYLRKG